MSWNLEVAGTKEVCKAAVNEEANIPSFVKTYMYAAIEACAQVATKRMVARGKKWGVYVKTFGHVDEQNYSNDTVVCPVRIE